MLVCLCGCACVGVLVLVRVGGERRGKVLMAIRVTIQWLMWRYASTSPMPNSVLIAVIVKCVSFQSVILATMFFGNVNGDICRVFVFTEIHHLRILHNIYFFRKDLPYNLNTSHRP